MAGRRHEQRRPPRLMAARRRPASPAPGGAPASPAPDGAPASLAAACILRPHLLVAPRIPSLNHDAGSLLTLDDRCPSCGSSYHR
jgi:hypothetical protein